MPTNPLTAEQKQLVMDHLWIAATVAKKIARSNLHLMPILDDMIQGAYVGLIKAAQNYRADRGTTFSTFAHYAAHDYSLLAADEAWAQLAGTLRQRHLRPPVVPIEDALSVAARDTGHADFETAHDAVVWRKRLVETVGERDAQVYEAMVTKDMRVGPSVYEQFGLTKARIYQIKQRVDAVLVDLREAA